jgi:hypothetical protein
MPSTTHFSEVRPSMPTGPRAWNLSVLMPISAPRPYSKPSAKRVLAFQQAFAGVAGAVLLRLGVVGHLDRHGQVAGVVHIGVAVAVQVLDDGHLGIAADALDQALAAARDDHVHILRHGNQLAHGLAVGGLHQLHRIGGRPASASACCTSAQRLVGLDGLGAAAQDAGVAALDGQAGGLDGDVGPALVRSCRTRRWARASGPRGCRWAAASCR